MLQYRAGLLYERKRMSEKDVTHQSLVNVYLVIKEARRILPRLVIALLCINLLSGLLPVALAAEEPSGNYRIHVGDQLDIFVEAYPEYNRQLPVLPNGTITFPRVGELQAAGRTPSELADRISEGLTNLNRPAVYVSVLMPQKNEIYVQGMVKQPGSYLFEGESIYLLQALTLAGGVDHERADMAHVRIFRGGQLHATVDINGLFEGTTKTDLALQPRDLVLIPSRLQQRAISVTGAVMNPDTFPVEESKVHVLRALWLAGGPIVDESDLERAVVIHPDGQVTQVNLKALSQNPASQADAYLLSPGDVLYIPNAYADEKISVIGEVKAPGQYPVKGPVDVIEALAMAGGFVQDQANLKKAFIQRADGTRERVDLTGFFELGATTSGVLVYPGDTLSIPRRMKINWSALYTVVLTASLIYNIAAR